MLFDFQSGLSMAAGYFGGYTSKMQDVGHKELQRMTDALARKVSVEKKKHGLRGFQSLFQTSPEGFGSKEHYPNGRGKCKLVTTSEPQGRSDGRMYPDVPDGDVPSFTSLETGRGRDEEGGWELHHRRLAPQPMPEG
jgi:hypothetical protein